MQVQRRIGRQHPAQRASDRAGRGQRQGMAGGDRPAIPVRTAATSGIRLHHQHVTPALLQGEAASEADNAPADHQHVPTLLHRSKNAPAAGATATHYVMSIT
jgi:hypothetical protein